MVVVGVLISAASWTETLLNTSGNKQVEDVEKTRRSNINGPGRSNSGGRVRGSGRYGQRCQRASERSSDYLAMYRAEL